MKHVVLVLAAALGSVLMLGAVPAPDAKGGVVSTAPPAITLAFNHRVMPRPLIRPPYPRPGPFRRPVYHRPAVTVIAPPPPPPVVVAPPASRPVRHVTLPLAEPVLVEQRVRVIMKHACASLPPGNAMRSGFGCPPVKIQLVWRIAGRSCGMPAHGIYERHHPASGYEPYHGGRLLVRVRIAHDGGVV